MVIPTRNNRAAVGNANRCHRIQCKQFTERKNKYDFLALQIEENKYILLNGEQTQYTCLLLVVGSAISKYQFTSSRHTYTQCVWTAKWMSLELLLMLNQCWIFHCVKLQKCKEKKEMKKKERKNNKPLFFT